MSIVGIKFGMKCVDKMEVCGLKLTWDSYIGNINIENKSRKATMISG